VLDKLKTEIPTKRALKLTLDKEKDLQQVVEMFRKLKSIIENKLHLLYSVIVSLVITLPVCFQLCNKRVDVAYLNLK
jgi:hypothetical protein